MFKEEVRVLLIDTVSKYIEVKGYKFTITDCANIERQICSLFPSETLSYYTNGKRGKLYNKLHNLKRHSKPLKDINQNFMQQETSFEPEPDSEFSIECLRNETITMDEFDLYWRKCSNYRFNQIKQIKSTKEVLKQWPEYNKPSGYKLIAIDFSNKFPKAKDMEVKWAQYENKLLDLLRSKIVNSAQSSTLLKTETYSEESKTLTIFWYLHQLLPPVLTTLTNPDGSKRRKKFTVADSQESFALIGKTCEELDAKLNLLKIQNSHINPILLVEGEIVAVKSIL